MSILKRIIDWNKERNIPRKFIKEKEIAHITEEITEVLRSNSIEGNIDGLGDIMVFLVGAIWKMKYDPDLVMEEVLKHIESRKGKWDDNINKWIKEESEVYYPDFSKCIDLE